MRVKFTRDFKGDKGEQSYPKGTVIDLDPGVGAQVVRDGYATEFPRSQKEVSEQAGKYYAGDDTKTPAQIADRVPQLVVLDGDTRQVTEDERNNDDPHVVRQADIETAESVADAKAKAAAARKS